MTILRTWLLLGLTFSLRAAPDPLPRSTPAAEGIDPVRLKRVGELLQGELKAGHYAGANVLVARHGKIVDWQSFGVRDITSGAPMEPDTICRIYSMSKVVTAVAVLQLFEQNRLRLSDPVTQWLPELKNLQVFVGGTAAEPRLEPATNVITVKMLLNHTAGFTYDFFQFSPVNELYTKADLWNSQTLDEFVSKVSRLPLVAQPGVAFNYSISDDLLGLLIQRVSGEPFDQYIARHITQPLQMNDTAFDVPVEKRGRLATLHEIRDGKLQLAAAILGADAEPGKGIPCGGAGLFSTIGDYARFAQCLLNGGELDGARILGRKTIELARMNSLPDGVGAFSPNDGWGLFSALELDLARSGRLGSVGTFFWSGAATTHFFVDPQEQLVALVFCQHFPFDQFGLFGRFHIAVYQALE